ncbi:MAG TPA: tetratricopeptide repeat protein [Candidatus Methanoperedens sp.]|nr:tetratricopeptide repeat protein [Candidatus Methanoperedens sp.]
MLYSGGSSHTARGFAMTGGKKLDSGTLAVIAALVLLVAAIYAPTVGQPFLNFDDNLYVTDNLHVQRGLNRADVRWSLTSFHAGFYIPLVWLSFMANSAVGGMNPTGYHLANVVLHAANAVLLFLVLRGYTGARWRSALVAALFAVHPLHVESVAWVTERKDVLFAFFGLLALGAYLRYARRPGAGSQAALLALLALSLLSKPMLVTLPVLLLLLDFWPLGRFGSGARPPGAGGARTLARLALEKVPVLVLAAAISVVTVIAGRRQGAVATLDIHPLWLRLENALVSTLAYLRDAVWPQGLAVLYPYRREGFPVLLVLLAALALAVATLLAVAARRRQPALCVGWLWYLVTLLPVIGLVQSGIQARADRFVYFPLLGVYLGLVWGAGALLGARGPGAGVRAPLAAAVVAALAMVSSRQVALWRDGVTLFRHAVAVTADNYSAHSQLGLFLAEAGRVDEAVEHFREALRIEPRDAQAHANLGMAAESGGRPGEAAGYYREALRLKPVFPEVSYNLGRLAFAAGRYEEAQRLYRETLSSRPADAGARNNLAACYAALGRLPEAIAEYRALLRARPEFTEARYNLASLLLDAGQPAEAAEHLREVLRQKPGFAPARARLDEALAPARGGRS